MKDASSNGQEVIHDYFAHLCRHVGWMDHTNAFVTPFTKSLPHSLKPNKARQKLLRLSLAQFIELSTDVNDELVRRESTAPGKPPCLASVPSLHPKRNQARQKLSILSATRFLDLATDILFEINRRFPDTCALPFDPEDPTNYADAPPPPAPPVNDRRQPPKPRSGPGPPPPPLAPPRAGSMSDKSSYESSPITPLDHQSFTPTNAHAQSPGYSLFSSHNSDYDRRSTDSRQSPYSHTFASPTTSVSSPSLSHPAPTPPPILHVPSPTPSSVSPTSPLPASDPAAAISKPRRSLDRLPQTVQTKTIVPTKGMLIEESDDSSSDEDPTSSKHRSYSSNGHLDETRGNEDRSRARRSSLDFTDDVSANPSRRHSTDDITSPIRPFRSSSSHDSRPPSILHSIIEEDLDEPGLASSLARASPTKRSMDRHSPTSGDEKDAQIRMLVEEGSRMDETINKLQQQLVQVEAEKASALEENGRLHDACSVAANEAAVTKAKVQELEASLKTLQTAQLQSNEQLQEADHNKAQLEELREKLGEVTDRSDELETQVGELKGQLEDSQNQLSIKSGHAEDLQLQLVEAKKGVERLKELEDTVEKLTTDLRYAESKYNTTQAEMSSLRDTNAELNEDLKVMRERNILMAEEHAAAQNSPTSSQSDRQMADQSQGEEARLSDLVKSKDAQLEKMEHEIMDLGAKLANALNQQTEIDASQVTLKRRNLALEQIVKEHEATIASGVGSDEGLVQKYKDLEVRHGRLQQELQEQQKVTEQVRLEAAAFLQEMKALAGNQNTNEHLASQLQSLRLEVQEWKSRYARSKTQVRSMRTSMYAGNHIAAPALKPEDPSMNQLFDPYGMVMVASVTSFQISMDELLERSRVDPSNLLDDLHDLVIATRRIVTDVTDGVEKSFRGDPSRIISYNQAVTSAVNHMITTTRNFSTSSGLAPISVLDTAASDLTWAVIGLIKEAKIRTPDDQNGSALEHSSSVSSSRTSTGRRKPRSPSVSETKSKPASQRTSESSSDAHRGYVNAGGDGAGNVSQVPRAHNSSLPANFNLADPDNTVAELQAFLETETVAVIDSVASVLSAIKENATVGELRPLLLAIPHSLDPVTEATESAISKTRKRQLKEIGRIVLQDLRDSCDRLRMVHERTREHPSGAYADEQFKQRIAGAAFDIAKGAKELMRIVEEVGMEVA